MPWSATTINQLIIQGTNAGLFIYNGTPALGTLIGSWAATAGTDTYGNTYPQGLYVITAATVYDANLITSVLTNSIIEVSAFNQGTIYESVITFDSGGGSVLGYVTATTTVTLNAGTTTYTSPVGVTVANWIRVWGDGASGGGGNASNSGPGGGAGEFTQYNDYPFIPSTVYDVFIGSGGDGVTSGNLGINGSGSVFDTGLIGPGVSAKFGKAGDGAIGGPGGAGSGEPIDYPGGSGAGGGNGLAGSGGGASAGPLGPGANGHKGGSSAGIGGVAQAGAGSGGNGGGRPGGAGNNGLTPGGGGGGNGYGAGGSTYSGNGGAGQIQINYNTSASTLLMALSPIANSDAAGNSYGAGYTGPVAAFAPGSSPASAEVWHNVGFGSSGLTGTLRVKRIAEDNFCILHANIIFNYTGSSQDFTLGSLPSSSYYPVSAGSHSYPCAVNATPSGIASSLPRIFIPTSGGIQLLVPSGSGSGANAGACIVYPLD